MVASLRRFETSSRERARALLSAAFALAALAAGTGRALALSPNFDAMLSYETAREPMALAIGDLNRDGRPDLAVACARDNVVSILLCLADGTFGPRSDQPAGSKPSSVAIGDLDGDGILDLAETNEGAATVGVMIGRGDGSFARPVEYTTGASPRDVAIGDVNRDGRPDLVIANYFDNSVSVLLGQDDGTFGRRVDFATGSQPVFVTLADLDGDGDQDLAVANTYWSYTNTSSYDARISVLLGNGDGIFAPRADYITGGVPTSIVIVDLNTDRHPDLVVAGPGQYLGVFLGEGGGAFAAKTALASFAATSVTVGDLNHDGVLDLVATNSERTYNADRNLERTSHFVSVARGNGDGTSHG